MRGLFEKSRKAKGDTTSDWVTRNQDGIEGLLWYHPQLLMTETTGRLSAVWPDLGHNPT